MTATLPRSSLASSRRTPTAPSPATATPTTGNEVTKESPFAAPTARSPPPSRATNSGR